MAASANGWRVLARAECTDIKVPGGVIPVHPKLATIFTDLAVRYHTLVEPLTWPGCWGWADRPIRGGTVTSNHASGTAVDLCAPAHPQGAPVSRTFTPAKLEAVWALEKRYGGVIAWGGDWDAPSTDGMHWELAPGTSAEQVDKVTAWLQAEASTPPPPPAAVRTPAPAPLPPAPAPAGRDLTGTGLALRGDVGNTGPRVAALQTFLRTRYPLYAKQLVSDGVWGARTTEALRQFALRSGITSADGRNIGPQLARKLYLAGARV